MSSHLDLVSCKKRKRGERVFKFKSFGEQGHPVDWDGSFWQNVKALLEFGLLEGNLCCGMPTWSFQLEVHRHPPLHLLLFVIVEELVEGSFHRHCKLCQYVGWGHHMICNKKYHFLVPSTDTAVASLNYEGDCERADFSTKPKPKPKAKAKPRPTLMELQGHILHGVIHSNGFGHLLCVNGLEMGNDLPGHQIMDFWDRLCTGLRARKVSLRDNSQKKSMELRLVYGVAYGEPWFSRWGYRFGRGSYGVTQPMYHKAIDAIQTMPLCLLLHHLGSFNHELSIIFSRYQTLSGHSLTTLGNLFHFMLELKSRLPEESCIDSYNPGILVETTCRWSPKRVEMATRVIVEALKRAEFKWISRQEVRDVARAYVGDTGLLDFVLKSLGNHIVGNYLIRRSLNPVTKVLEYRLEDISGTFLNHEGLATKDSKMKARYMITRSQLMKDLFYLYWNILKEQKPTITGGILATIPMASRIILDTKYLIKEYDNGELPSKSQLGIPSESKISCAILLKNSHHVNQTLEKAMPPYESLTLDSNATFDELKQQVENTFRGLYWGLRSFVIESVVNLNVKGSDLVSQVVKAGGKLVFEGRCGTGEGGLLGNGDIFEGGGDQAKCVVDCSCGAKEDDGERMVCCDICEVWQHTRCVRIPNNQEIPTIFLCSQCEQDILLFPCLP